MGWNKPDVYHQPEEFGLTIVASAARYEDYGFDMFVVWRDADGNLLYASDAGCSCPSPFEDVTSVDMLTRGNKFEAINALVSWSKSWDDDSLKSGLSVADVTETLMKIAAL